MAGNPRKPLHPQRAVALLRGINVGKAKRVAMADLRALMEDLDCREVRTLLNSGNVVFTAAKPLTAARIEAALLARCGVQARATMIDAADFEAIVTGNPFADRATDPSRLLVAFLNQGADLHALAGRDWTPEALALGSGAAYLWCAGGVLASPLWDAVNRVAREGVTSRNWTTVLKLQAMLKDRSPV